MKKIIFIDHSEKRRKQRGYSNIEIEFAIERPHYRKNRKDGRVEVIGFINNKKIRIVYEEEESYLKIITII